MRGVSLKQDLTGIVKWRLADADDDEWSPDKTEIYGVNAPHGKRLRLSIQKKPCGAVSSLEFRRSSAPSGGETEAPYNPRNDGDGWFGL